MKVDAKTKAKAISTMAALVIKEGISPDLRLAVVWYLQRAGFDREFVSDYIDEVCAEVKRRKSDGQD